MFVAVSRITFESGETSYDQKELKSLTESLKKRFQVCVKVDREAQSFGHSIVVTCLDHKNETLSSRLDKISLFCEESGFGRIESEETFFDHVENLFEN